MPFLFSEISMFERIGRGWGIAKASWAVLKQHPKLIVFPIFSGIAFLLLLGSIAASLYAGSGTQRAHDLFNYLERVNFEDPIVYGAAFLFYFVTSFIIIFFNAALVFCALEAFAGRTPSLRGGFYTAVGRLPQILAWALVAATVGLLLNTLQNMLRDKLGFLGSLLGGLLEVAWAVVTYFVVPVLVVDGVGPIEAVKRSSTILKRTWGESVGGEGGLGIISFLLMLPAFALIFLAIMAGSASGPLLLVLIPLIVLYIVALSVVFTALGTIFRTGTYIYATTGKAPTSMDQALLQATFCKKE
jgi:Family of unknown function (DUF6159)